jgi:hypothetical protein
MEVEACSRNPVGKHTKGRSTGSNISSAGSVLCCSSLKSAEIRNCNKVFWANQEQEVASKLWKGMTELGIEGEEEDEWFVEKFLLSENRTVIGNRQREQNKHSYP